MIDPLNICRICGLDNGEPIWEDGLYPTYNFCACCGCEFGYNDYEIEEIRKYRENWLIHQKWDMPNLKPKEWDLESQLSQIPKEFL